MEATSRRLGKPLGGKERNASITRFDTTGQKATIAGEVKPKGHPYGLIPTEQVDHKVQRQVDPFIVYAIDAAGQALEDAGLHRMDDDLKQRTDVSIGSGIGGLPRNRERIFWSSKSGAWRGQPTFRSRHLINLTSGQVSIKYG